MIGVHPQAQAATTAVLLQPAVHPATAQVAEADIAEEVPAEAAEAVEAQAAEEDRNTLTLTQYEKDSNYYSADIGNSRSICTDSI